MKTVNFIDDSTISVDGEVFRKEKTLPSEPKYVIGKWYTFPIGSEDDQRVYRVTAIRGDRIEYDSGTKVNTFETGSMRDDVSRPATPQEIESHLRKICDEKYVGKKVKSAGDGHIDVVKDFDFVSQDKTVFYRGVSDRAIVVYDNKGEWAEILPDLKPLPKTREEFYAFREDWQKHPNHNFNEFLDQYQF